MNSNDGKNIAPEDANRINEGSCAQGNNAASIQNSKGSTIKIDSLCIKLGFVKEKGDTTEKCSHFSIRGYVAGMRERGSSNFIPFAQELPPMDVKHFRYWLCQSCVRNYGTANTSHETKLVSACDQSMVLPGTRPCAPQDCNGVAVLPFGEGTSGVKPVDSMNNDDENILPVLGADESRLPQEIPANDGVSQEPTTLCSSDTNVAAEANTSTPGRKESNELSDDDDDPQEANVVKETIPGVVGPPIQSSQQNDYPNGHPRRKARKVRLLKELLCGNTKIQKQKKENSASLGPKPSPPLPPSQIKRKMLHDQDHDHEHEHDLDRDQDQNQNQRSIDIPTPGSSAKKAKTFKGITAPKTTMVEHPKDSKPSEAAQNDNKYLWNKHGTQRNSNFGKVSSDPVTAWRSIFSDMGKTDNQVASKDRGTEPYSNLLAPPHPDKKFKKISRNPPKSKFFSEDSRRTNVGGGGGGGGSRSKDGRSDTELGLGLSLNYEPQAQIRFQPSIPTRPPIQDQNSRKPDFFLGESSVSHRIPSDSRSKQGSLHDVSNMHPPRTMLLQEQQRPYTQLSYGNCSVHQKLDFTDPHKRNTGFRGYSDVMRPHNHQRQGKIGRSDEREIVELMAKNQYERNLCDARISQPSSWQPPSHHEYHHHPAGRFFYQDQVSDYNMFNTFPQSRNQSSNAMWTSDPGAQRHNYHHVSKGNNTRYTSANMQVLEALNNYQNGNGNGRQRNQTSRDLFSNFPVYRDGFARFSEKDKEKSMMDLDLNVVAPNVTEENNNFESLDMNQKNIRSYPNETIPAMQLLSLMDSGKSNHSSKTLSSYYNHKPKPITNQNPNPNPHLRPTGNSRNLSFSSFQTDQNVMLPMASSYGHKPLEEKSSYDFPLPWHAIEDRVTFGSKINPSGTDICTTNKNPADFSSPGPENMYMISVEHLVCRSAVPEKRQKRP